MMRLLRGLCLAACSSFSTAPSLPPPVSSATVTFAPGESFSMNPTSVEFGNQMVNTTSAPRAVTVTNTGSTPQPVLGRINGPPGQWQDYAPTDDCPSMLAVGASCTFNVTFTPSATGDRVAYLVVDGVNDEEGLVNLGGTGTLSMPTQSDFNGDGTPDLVFQNDTTRQVLVWYLSGPPADSLVGWDWLATTGVTGWRLVSTADFNGDGKPDLVWQNDSTRQVLVWYMGGSLGNTFLWWDWLAPSALDSWRLVAAVDLNRDGKPDLVWQNDATFQVVVWYMGGPNGNSFLGSDSLAMSGVDGWRLMATGDFDGDGTPDLVWQNDARQAVVWYMIGPQGSVFWTWNWLSVSSEVGWTIVGANDLNGDGRPDLVWQNDDTREVLVWYMGGGGGNVLQAWQSLATTGVAGWTTVAR